jgi:hypothetical protein
VDFVVCTIAMKKKSGQVSTCRIGPFPCELSQLAKVVWVYIEYGPSYNAEHPT